MKEDKPYGDFSREEIREAVEYIFNQPREIKLEERKIKLVSYCRGIDGPKSFSSEVGGMNLCSHPECHQCRNFEELFKEEFNKQIEQLNK